MESNLLVEDAADGISPSLGIVFGTRVVVLGLGECVSATSRLQPGATFLGSTLEVELVKAKELSGLLDIVIVFLGSLFGISSTDLSVFVSRQASGNVRVGANGALLDLWPCETKERS